MPLFLLILLYGAVLSKTRSCGAVDRMAAVASSLRYEARRRSIGGARWGGVGRVEDSDAQ